jgi:antitoxin ParD1/3/4
MNVSLSPAVKRLVDEKVESGLYRSADDVLMEALRLLDERDRLRQTRLEDLRREIAIGIEQADRGDVAPLDMDEIRIAVQQRLIGEQDTR